jgi:DNA-binding transcriptional regulator YdaS (Cro superfamily)
MTQLQLDQRRHLAGRCGIGDAYLYQILSGRKLASPELCIVIERESSGAIRCEDLRPDVDWAYIRATNCPALGCHPIP